MEPSPFLVYLATIFLTRHSPWPFDNLEKRERCGLVWWRECEGRGVPFSSSECSSQISSQWFYLSLKSTFQFSGLRTCEIHVSGGVRAFTVIFWSPSGWYEILHLLVALVPLWKFPLLEYRPFFLQLNWCKVWKMCHAYHKLMALCLFVEIRGRR